MLKGRYERISITLRDVQASVEGDAVRLPVLDVDARNVRASLDTLRTGQGDVVADTVDGTGTISYEPRRAAEPTRAHARRAGWQARRHRPGRHPRPEVHRRWHRRRHRRRERQGSPALQQLDAAGLPNLPLARTILNRYAEGISIDVPLPDLPFQLAVREVRPLPEGLAVTADAKNVPINSVG